VVCCQADAAAATAVGSLPDDATAAAAVGSLFLDPGGLPSSSKGCLSADSTKELLLCFFFDLDTGASMCRSRYHFYFIAVLLFLIFISISIYKLVEPWHEQQLGWKA
jgi:hypothetical protein